MSIKELAQDAITIGSIQIPCELEKFGEFVKNDNIPRYSNIVEIGSKYGGTTYFLARLLFDCDIISIDAPRAEEWQETPKYRNRWFKVLFDNRVKWIVGDSHLESTKNELTSLLHKWIDLLFIDGDHSYQGVKQDFEMYSPLVKDGGLIVFHDIKDTQHHRNLIPPCMVGPFWNEIKDEYKHYEFCDNSENWGGIGVLIK